MKILVVDDHPLFLEGLQLVLKKLPFHVETLSADSIERGEKILKLYRVEINLALVDLNLPKKGGVLFVRTLTSKRYLIPTIIVSAEEDVNRIKKSLKAGAQGFIPKSSSCDVMLSAILKVLGGGYYLPSYLESLMVAGGDEIINHFSPKMLEGKRLELGVSIRQYETLTLMARGLSNREVADNLFLSEHTVKSHTSVLFQLLDVTNRTECVVRAKKLKLIE